MCPRPGTSTSSIGGLRHETIEKRCARAPGHLLARLEALGMKPVINSHLDYRRFLNGIGGMYRINWRSKPPAIREIYLRFRELDLSAVDRIMQDQYSSRGAEPRPPSCMLRSTFVAMATNSFNPDILLLPIHHFRQDLTHYNYIILFWCHTSAEQRTTTHRSKRIREILPGNTNQLDCLY